MLLEENKKKTLESLAKQVRRGVITSIRDAGPSGHPGGSLSCVDIMVYLYFHEMKMDFKYNEFDDVFHLSKGHAAPTLYDILKIKNQIEKNRPLRTLGGLDGHPSNDEIGIFVSSGSLGQGVSVAAGMALAQQIKKRKVLEDLRKKGKETYLLPGKVYCLVGDGELQEPEPWAGLMFAAHYRLNNLCVIVDKNNLQIDGEVDKVMSLGDLEAKAKAFGCEVATFDGHDFTRIAEAFSYFRLNAYSRYKPTFLIANTVKGKGVSFMENKPEYHGAITKEECEKALEELR